MKLPLARNQRGHDNASSQILRPSCIFSNCDQLTSKPDTIDEDLVLYNL